MAGGYPLSMTYIPVHRADRPHNHHERYHRSTYSPVNRKAHKAKDGNVIPLDATKLLVSFFGEFALHPDHGFEARVEIWDTKVE